ncbi:hypothetical protein GOP47_0008430 [Adiantum capillus-veneris]|uniref:Uncharacterized protein n=1 Tax=Adiantum capillus-veneris TaxID=13818 RepID=A0A9D4UYA5_ADICA|nr:hypothetical protein GOP47_0008430 [Adiantum capillus-veneris]
MVATCIQTHKSRSMISPLACYTVKACMFQIMIEKRARRPQTLCFQLNELHHEALVRNHRDYTVVDGELVRGGAERSTLFYRQRFAVHVLLMMSSVPTILETFLFSGLPDWNVNFFGHTYKASLTLNKT